MRYSLHPFLTLLLLGGTALAATPPAGAAAMPGHAVSIPTRAMANLLEVCHLRRQAKKPPVPRETLEIFRALRDEEPGAFERFDGVYRPRLRDYFQAKRVQPADNEDLVQITLAWVFRLSATIDLSSNPENLVYTLAERRYADFLRRRYLAQRVAKTHLSVLQFSEGNREDQFFEDPSHVPVERALVVAEQAQSLARNYAHQVALLPEFRRQVYEATAIAEGFTGHWIQEAAARYEIPRAKVDDQTFQARESLRRDLAGALAVDDEILSAAAEMLRAHLWGAELRVRDQAKRVRQTIAELPSPERQIVHEWIASRRSQGGFEQRISAERWSVFRSALRKLKALDVGPPHPIALADLIRSNRLETAE